MKVLFRSFLINIVAVFSATNIIPVLTVNQGLKGYLMAGIVFMLASHLVTPFLKIILLPLNLLTLGIFAWLSSVLTLYILVSVLPVFNIQPYYYEGALLNGFIIPATQLTTFQTAILCAFLIAFIIHVMRWLIE